VQAGSLSGSKQYPTITLLAEQGRLHLYNSLYGSGPPHLVTLSFAKFGVSDHQVPKPF
jgi:hypothetical protein